MGKTREWADLQKIRALLNVVTSEDGGGVQLSGESAALVADAIGELDDLRARVAELEAGEVGDEQHRQLRQAIADPGSFLPRGDKYTEPIPRWSARAVIAAGWRPVMAPRKP